MPKDQLLKIKSRFENKGSYNKITPNAFWQAEGSDIENYLYKHTNECAHQWAYMLDHIHVENDILTFTITPTFPADEIGLGQYNLKQQIEAVAISHAFEKLFVSKGYTKIDPEEKHTLNLTDDMDNPLYVGIFKFKIPEGKKPANIDRDLCDVMNHLEDAKHEWLREQRDGIINALPSIGTREEKASRLAIAKILVSTGAFDHLNSENHDQMREFNGLVDNLRKAERERQING